MQSFNYETAFSRNIGWVTQAEQQKLRASKVAIGGLGGVGGVHLLTLARMGVGKFSIADFDTFDLVNFNRQIGANINTLHRPKLDVLQSMLLEINPEAEVTTFPKGLSADSIDEFLENVDVYIDGLDFFAFEARMLTFAKCEEKRIPVITAAPLGLGTAVVIFTPESMSFMDYFGFADCQNDPLKMAIRFLIGLSPAMLQRGYLVDMAQVNLIEKRGPSSIAACQLCAGVAATEALKLLLNRKGIKAAPHASQFDAYRMQYVRTWRPWGYKNPLQQLMARLVKHQLSRSHNPDTRHD